MICEWVATVCVCFLPIHSGHQVDVPAGVTQEEGHTGFFIHLLSAVRALIFLARRIQPFLSLVDRDCLTEHICSKMRQLFNFSKSMKISRNYVCLRKLLSFFYAMGQAITVCSSILSYTFEFEIDFESK